MEKSALYEERILLFLEEHGIKKGDSFNVKDYDLFLKEIISEEYFALLKENCVLLGENLFFFGDTFIHS